MAYFTQTHETPISVRFSIAAASLAEDIKKYRLYRKTVSELQKLPTATLTDLGLSRSGINASAREAVYGC
ncbi:MAG: DUF1127 domain-containing protein [Proteobacteria bacterium]|nr:DUF1127 domain-containing protein [Pseudomonadota bacterium]